MTLVQADSRCMIRTDAVRSSTAAHGVGATVASGRTHPGGRDEIRSSLARLSRIGSEGADMLNLNSQTLDERAAKIGAAFESSPAKAIEKNVKALLTSGLARLDVVTRAEFDVQREVLQRTREKVEKLEVRVAELEARSAGVMPPPPVG